VTYQSDFPPLTTPDTGDYFDVLEALGGGLYRNVKVLKENLLVNSSDLTFLNGKGVFAGTTLNDLVYFGSRDIDGNVNVAHITAISANSPYALLGTTCFFTAGASVAALTGYLGSDYTSYGTVGAGEDDLTSVTHVANQFNVTGRGISYSFGGYTANNANVKTVRIRAGATLLATLVLPLSVLGVWKAEFGIIRTGVSTQRASGTLKTYTTIGTVAVVTEAAIEANLTLTETNTITVKSTGEGVSNNDVVGWRGRWEHI